MPLFHDGGDAFPTTEFYDERPIDIRKGMSLRDYLAAHAPIARLTPAAFDSGDIENYAARAYAWADAMLAARREGCTTALRLEGGRR